MTNYDMMMTQLLAGAPKLQGVLIGVVNVANAPVLFTSAALLNQQFLFGLGQAAGKTLTTDNTCTGSDGSLISLQIATDIRNGKRPTVISCTGDSPLVQDDILTLSEQAEVSAIVTGYNTFIAAKARQPQLERLSLDPNPILAEPEEPRPDSPGSESGEPDRAVRDLRDAGWGPPLSRFACPHRKRADRCDQRQVRHDARPHPVTDETESNECEGAAESGRPFILCGQCEANAAISWRPSG